MEKEGLAESAALRGLRDEGLLDSLLARPQNSHSYKSESTIAELAAAYGYGIAQASSLPVHRFVFLAINGYWLAADQVNAIRTMLAVAGGELGEEGLAATKR